MDRNDFAGDSFRQHIESLSARRAWIEISATRNDIRAYRVALRKESVDRNTQRRDFKRLSLVALRKESVDRNVLLANGGVRLSCRSPQGERG